MNGKTDESLAWRDKSAPSLADFEIMADAAYRRLPRRFRDLCRDLLIRIEDFPAEDIVQAMRLETEFDLLGLFQGVGLPFQADQPSGQMPNMVWLYRRPILDYWAEHEERLGDIITHVLVHEIGHHFGLSDADMTAIEAAAG